MTTKTLPHLLLGVALLGASSFSLSAGGAKAAQVCTFQPCVQNPVPTAVGDKKLTVLTGPTAGAGKVDFDTYFVAGKPTYQVDTDFNPGPLVGAPGGTTGTFSYQLSIDPLLSNGAIFGTAALSWSGVSSIAGAPSVIKNIYSNSTLTALIASLSGNAANGDPNSSVNFANLGLTDIWVTDTYTVPEGAQLDNFENTYTQVPGPLPLLGAGTAFGFSRRLRRRSTKARMSLG